MYHYYMAFLVFHFCRNDDYCLIIVISSGRPTPKSYFFMNLFFQYKKIFHFHCDGSLSVASLSQRELFCLSSSLLAFPAQKWHSIFSWLCLVSTSNALPGNDDDLNREECWVENEPSEEFFCAESTYDEHSFMLRWQHGYQNCATLTKRGEDEK